MSHWGLHGPPRVMREHALAGSAALNLSADTPNLLKRMRGWCHLPAVDIVVPPTAPPLPPGAELALDPRRPNA